MNTVINDEIISQETQAYVLADICGSTAVTVYQLLDCKLYAWPHV